MEILYLCDPHHLAYLGVYGEGLFFVCFGGFTGIEAVADRLFGIGGRISSGEESICGWEWYVVMYYHIVSITKDCCGHNGFGKV